MESERHLLSGLHIPEAQEHQIYNDLKKVNKQFGLTVKRVDTPTFRLIELRGPIFVPIGNATYGFPIIILLQFPGFPLSPPTIRINVTAGVQVAPSQAVGYDGTINVMGVLPWRPGTNVSDVVSALVPFFQRYPVVTHQSLPVMRVDSVGLARLGVEEAVREVARVQKAVEQQVRTENAALRAQCYLKLVERKRRALEGQSTSQKGQPQAEGFAVPPEMQARAMEEARDLKLMSVIECLKEAMHNGAITIDDMVKATREMSREHFLSEVLPTL